ncbi:MAG: adenosylcobinamide-GDP ribazoletransferase [Thermodesulfobacteriota bacterium]
MKRWAHRCAPLQRDPAAESAAGSWSNIKYMPRLFLIALQFLTVFRLRHDLRETPEELAASVAYYPLVGLILGLLCLGVGLLLKAWFFPLVIGLLITLALAAFTRGLHLDGLADTADGLLSHRDRERKLAIMKDSAIGVFGALALIFAVVLKASLLAGLLDSPLGPAAIVLFPVWSRWAVSLTAGLSTYARVEGGLGRPFVNLAGPREILAAGVITAAISLIVLGLPGLLVALLIGLAALFGVRIWRREIGGVTGDILGAVNEMCEVLGLILIGVLA